MLPKILDKKSAKECMEESQKYAEQFGIIHLMNKKPYELSGGEKKSGDIQSTDQQSGSDTCG